MARYRKRPVVIEAVQFVGLDNGGRPLFEGATQWLTTAMDKRQLIPHGRDQMVVKTKEGPISASKGDWIIRGVAGELYPCKPEIFDQTYDPADGD